jgi:hypothetical protein
MPCHIVALLGCCALRASAATKPTEYRLLSVAWTSGWNTKNLCVLSCTQLLHVSASLSAHLQPPDIKISSKRKEMKYLTTSVHAECCDISSAELYRCQLPEDGQIIAPKHVSAMQKTVRIMPYRYNSTCTLTVTYCGAVGLKKKSALGRWPDNSVETCSSYVQYSSRLTWVCTSS